MRDWIIKGVLLLWLLPMVLFWGWFGLSASGHDFGTVFLSRELHDIVMGLYGELIGVPPSQVPWLIAQACAVDTGLVFAIAAFRWRARWLPRLRSGVSKLKAAISAPQGEFDRWEGPAVAEGLTPQFLPAGPARPAE